MLVRYFLLILTVIGPLWHKAFFFSNKIVLTGKLYELRNGLKSTNPSFFNIIRWVTVLMGHTTHGPSVGCSKYFFFIISCQLLRKNCFNLIFSFITYKIKSFECLKSIRIKRKKIMRVTSDAGWWVICPSDPVYHIEDCQI